MNVFTGKNFKQCFPFTLLTYLALNYTMHSAAPTFITLKECTWSDYNLRGGYKKELSLSLLSTTKHFFTFTPLI